MAAAGFRAAAVPPLSRHEVREMVANNPIKNTIHFIIVLLLLFGFRYLPAAGGLSDVGMQVIGVFAGVIYGWINIGIGWPSVLGIVAFGLTDHVTMTGLLSTAFGSQTMVMITTLLLLAAFVQQADLTDLILRFLITRRSAQGRPFLVLFYFLLAGFIACILSHCLAVLIIFLELFKEIMRKSGIAPYSDAVPCFFVGMSFSFVLGDIALPFKSTAIVGIGAYEAMTGASMDLLLYTLFMLPLCLLCIASYVLCCKYLFRVDLTKLTSDNFPRIDASALPLRKKVSLAAVLVAMAALLLPSVVPSDTALAGLLSGMGLGGLSLFILAVLLIIRVDGEPLMDLQKVAGHFSWNVFFLLCFLLPIAGALSSDAIGLKQILTSGATSFLQGLPGLAIIAVIAFMAAICTNFSNNIVVCGIFVATACFLGGVITMDLRAVVCIIIASSSVSIFFPAASPLNAVLFLQKELVTFRQLFLFGIKTTIIQCLLIAIVGSLLSGVIF